MRSLLFVPGDDEDKLVKALESGADALIVDLEDSISLERKQAARRIAHDFLQDTAGRPAPRLYVRINPLHSGLARDDLGAVIPARPEGVMLPKAVSGNDVKALSKLLNTHELDHGGEPGDTRIIVIATEVPEALFHMGTYSGITSRLTGLTWGGEDLSAALGARANRAKDGAYLDPYRLARSLCLFGAAAAGVQAIDSVYTNFGDLKGLKAECLDGVRDGFTGKMAIHPDQIPVINKAFTPTPDEVARAETVTAAFEAAEGKGVIALNGEMLDRPHLVRAQTVIEQAKLALGEI